MGSRRLADGTFVVVVATGNGVASVDGQWDLAQPGVQAEPTANAIAASGGVVFAGGSAGAVFDSVVAPAGIASTG